MAQVPFHHAMYPAPIERGRVWVANHRGCRGRFGPRPRKAVGVWGELGHGRGDGWLGAVKQERNRNRATGLKAFAWLSVALTQHAHAHAPALTPLWTSSNTKEDLRHFLACCSCSNLFEKCTNNVEMNALKPSRSDTSGTSGANKFHDCPPRRPGPGAGGREDRDASGRPYYASRPLARAVPSTDFRIPDDPLLRVFSIKPTHIKK